MKCTKWYLGGLAKIIASLLSVIGSAILINQGDRTTVVNYYCSKNTLFGFDITKEPYSIYCGSVVYVIHILIGAIILWILLLLVCLIIDAFLFIFNPKRKINQAIIRFFYDLLFRPKLKYSLFIDTTKSSKDICIQIVSSWFTRKCELNLDFNSLRAFKDKDLDTYSVRHLLSANYKIFQGIIRRGQKINAKIGEIKGNNQSLVLSFYGFNFLLSKNGEFTYFFYESGKCGKRDFAKIRKSVEFIFHQNKEFIIKYCK